MALLRLGKLQQFLSIGSRESQKRLRWLCLGRAAARHWLELISRCLKGSIHLPAPMEEEQEKVVRLTPLPPSLQDS